MLGEIGMIHPLHSYYIVLRRLLKEYEKGSDIYKGETFSIAVALILKAMELNDLAKKVEVEPELAYPIAKKLVEDYFTMKNDIVVGNLTLRRIVETLSKNL